MFLGGILLFLVAPFIVIIVGSLAGGAREYIAFPPRSLSLQWYLRIPGRYLSAFQTSLIVALAVSGVAAVLGSLAAFAIVRGTHPGRALVQALFSSPLQIPHIVVGVAVLQFYYLLVQRWGVDLLGTMSGLIAAHVVVTVPYVIGSVVAVLTGFNVALEEAALNLGASRISTLRRVTLPIIAPGVIVGALYAFIMSFGNVPISLFLVKPGVTTLPVEVFFGIEFDFNPSLLALSTIVVLFSVSLVMLLQRIVGLDLLRAPAQRGG